MKYLLLILTALFLCSCVMVTTQVKTEPQPDLLAVTYPLQGTVIEKDGIRYYVIDHLELQKLLKELRKDSIIILDQKDKSKDRASKQIK